MFDSRLAFCYSESDANHDHAVTQMGYDHFTYDGNGNQITRQVGGNSYTLSYDAENHLVAVTGAATATFVYDGDGNRVEGTIGGVTTTYIGNYFEWNTSTEVMVKYYYAGSTRVAMRTGTDTLNYLLGDHPSPLLGTGLGSQAITTDSNGANLAEIRYYPWGTERYSSGTTPSGYRFTGQRLESLLGLYFYNSRWYDPTVGRFIQADTIVPGGVQGLDRYAYVFNNPLRYIDPSGYMACSDMYDFCGQMLFDGKITVSILRRSLHMYGISLFGNWDLQHAQAVYFGAGMVGERLALERGLGESSTSAYKARYQNGVNLRWDPYCNGCRAGTKQGTDIPCGDDYISPGCKPGGGFSAGNTITFASMTGDYVNDLDRMIKNVVHEFGEVFYYEIGRPRLGASFSRDALRPDSTGRFDWQQHPPDINKNGVDYPNDLFSDTFIAWTYNAWNRSTDWKIMLIVNAAMIAMNNLVSTD